LQEKIANQRKDFQHKLTRWLVDEFGVIGLESLNVKIL
jgi:transposase